MDSQIGFGKTAFSDISKMCEWLIILSNLVMPFLEFDALSRLGIPDAVSYIKKRYKATPLLFLKAACVGQGLVDQVEASVGEAISSGTWVAIAVCFMFLSSFFCKPITDTSLVYRHFKNYNT